MRVSEFLKQYLATGELPNDEGQPPELCFWTGWLIGNARRAEPNSRLDQNIETAIRAAEFIESHAK